MESRSQLVGGGEGMEGLSKMVKGLMNMDNRMLIAGEGKIRELSGNGKNTIIFLK